MLISTMSSFDPRLKRKLSGWNICYNFFGFEMEDDRLCASSIRRCHD